MLVVGLGNALRGDDAIGLEVARTLAARRPDLEVVVHEREPIDLIELWTGVQKAIVIDALAGEDPGRIHHVVAGAAEEIRLERQPSSSHTLHLSQVIELAGLLGRLPPQLDLIAIEGSRFDLGTQPAPPVRHAGHRVASSLLGGPAAEAALRGFLR